MSSTVKFVYIHWVGEKVPFNKKGRFGVVHGSIKNYFTVSVSQVVTPTKQQYNRYFVSTIGPTAIIIRPNNNNKTF